MALLVLLSPWNACISRSLPCVVNGTYDEFTGNCDALRLGVKLKAHTNAKRAGRCVMHRTKEQFIFLQEF